MYFVKTPGWLKKIYHHYYWHLSKKEKVIYLTFDDGPHPTATPFVLNELKKFNAKATFFCIGKNVVDYPDIYQRILLEGHAVGNHSHNHLNGWKTENNIYYKNITLAAQYIKSDLFRPPYGRITRQQAKRISAERFANGGFKVIMWDVLSGDFDVTISPEKCLQNVINNTGSGSIIVFHDSTKAFKNMHYALQGTLKYFSEKGFKFDRINTAALTKRA